MQRNEEMFGQITIPSVISKVITIHIVDVEDKAANSVEKKTGAAGTADSVKKKTSAAGRSRKELRTICFHLCSECTL